MLSRVAESLYWIGRYLERSENVTRLLMVTTEMAVEIEGLNDELAQVQWDELLASVGAEKGAPAQFSPESGLALPYLNWLLLDEANPVSVRESLSHARENARNVREALTREVFLDLNEGHRELDRLRESLPSNQASALDEVSRTHRAIRTILGSIEHTLSRDEGWHFMKLGEAFERTQRTLWVLGTRLPGLQELDRTDLPLLYGLWRGLLRSNCFAGELPSQGRSHARSKISLEFSVVRAYGTALCTLRRDAYRQLSGNVARGRCRGRGSARGGTARGAPALRCRRHHRKAGRRPVLPECEPGARPCARGRESWFFQGVKHVDRCRTPNAF